MKTRLWLCGMAIAALSIGASPVLAATACQVSYKVVSEWNGNTGFGAEVKITNQGDPLNGWKVSWDMPSGQKVTGLWNGQVTQTQAHVEVASLSWNRKVATGGIIEFGFNGSSPDANDNPTNISVNGVKCSGQSSAPPPPVVVACTANYKIVKEWWGNGASVDVRIRNSGSALKGWTVAWDMPNGEKVTGAWNVQATQSQNHVEMKNVDWNRYVASGADIQFGFNLQHSGVNGIPGNLSVNGVLCNGQGTNPPPPTVTIPSAPTALSATVSGTTVSLKWTDQSNNEQGFRVERQLSGETTWTRLTDTAAGVQTYSDSTVAAGKTYQYRVSAFNTAGSSTVVTASATTAPAVTVPTAPAALSATVSGTTVSLKWTDQSNNEQGFRIERQLSGETTWTRLTDTAAGVQTYSDSTVAAGKTYQYRVSAFNTAGSSAAVTASATTAPAVTVPAAPAALSATVSGTTVSLKWTDQSNNEQGFRIERQLSGEAVWTRLTDTAAGVQAYSDSTVAAGKTYQYRVSAFNTAGSSAAVTASATTAPAVTLPTAPSGLSATVIDNGAVDLAWSDQSSNEQGFRVDRRVTGEATWTTVTDTAANAKTYHDAAVAMGKVYEYRVYAFNSAGASAAITATATLLTLKQYGEQQYAARNCSGCHGANGKGGISPLPDYTEPQLTSLAGTIAATMPKGSIKCTGNCALATARYLVDVMAESNPPPVAKACVGIEAAPRPRSLRLLTRQEYQNTVNDLLGLSTSLINSMPQENRVDGFDNYVANNLVTGLRMESFYTQAQALATQAVKNSWSKIVPCSTQDTACAKQFIQTFGKKAYRRPLTAAEQADYLTLFGGNTFSTAVEITVWRMLASPHFLYRSELGTLQSDGTYRLTPYETASALSYLFLGSLPDDALFSAADQNQLATGAQLEAQATRLLGQARTREQIGNFVGGWLLSSSPYTLPNKDAAVYPRYTADVKLSMSNELINFFNHVALDSTQKFPELFSANYVVANKTLADFYGVGGSSGSNFSVLPVSDTTRFGIMTLGAVLARYANGNESHPFKRGGFFYNRLLCHDLPFPQNAGFVPVPKPDPNLTTRQRFDYHSKSGEQCWSCHKFLDPAGFTFENYDGAGQYRATEKGNPIDATGTVLGMETFTEGEQVSVGNLRDLSQLMAASPTASQCVARQYYRYTAGRREGDEDSCVLDSYLQGYSASGYNLKTMLMSIVTSPGFTLRRSN